MKLVAYRHAGARATGIQDGDRIVDITGDDSDESFRETLADISSGMGLAETVADIDDQPKHSIKDVILQPPIPQSGRLFALGGVYVQHLRERGQSLSRVPSQWLVPPTAIVGEGNPIVLPDPVRENVLPAVELGIIIGKSGHYIDQATAMDHVAGYTVVNDVTARTDWPGPMGYKLMDTFSPCGPAVTPAHQVEDPLDLKMGINHCGDEICRGSSGGMRFSLQFLISYLSSIIKLRPGDVIATGDPGRVSGTLTVGQSVTASIESVGQLTNPVESND